MQLTKKQFNLLVALEGAKTTLSQRELAKQTGCSVGTVNKLMNGLAEGGLVSEGRITSQGLDALEPYRVKRAIIMAAGFGSRLVPITLNTPKPLVRVRGQRIIDSTLDALVAAGIPEIYIIRGYLAEQFDQLLYKYPMIKFIENPMYNEANNIASAACAGPLLRGAYVLEADLLLHNPALITKYQYESNYLGIPMEKTDDWCFHVEGDVIRKMAVGGVNCHQMVGISYWTEADGSRLVEHIKEVYQAPGGKERYWDQVPLEYHLSDYTVHVRECSAEDIIEIDTFSELKKLDKTYCV